jgi:hypothetical protein
MPANDFLWAPDSPVNRDAAGQPRFLGGMMLAPEAGQIVAETLRADPLGVARAMAGNALVQLGSFGIGDTLDEAHFAVAIRPRIEQGFSVRELAAFDQARQGQGLALTLTLFLLAAVLGNALICGGLSAPHPRYGARIMWLLPAAALLCSLAITMQQGRKRG